MTRDEALIEALKVAREALWGCTRFLLDAGPMPDAGDLAKVDEVLAVAIAQQEGES